MEEDKLTKVKQEYSNKLLASRLIILDKKKIIA
jgi:hypothetical protein